MAPVGTGLEVTRLANLLGMDPEELAGLAEVPAAELRELRHAITGSVHSRHERRFRRLAKLVKKTPMALSAKVAKVALGPVISARVAGSLDPADAIALANHLDVDFMAKVASHLDPGRVGDIISALPSDIVIESGRRMLQAGELAALGGLVSAVSTEDALAVAESAGPAELLQIGLFTEEPESLDELISALSDAQVHAVVDAAASSDHIGETVLLVGALGSANIRRLLEPIAAKPPEVRDRFVDAVLAEDGEVAQQSRAVLRDLGLLPQ